MIAYKIYLIHCERVKIQYICIYCYCFVSFFQFGKGVYFADMSSKSANYCFATRTKKTGILLLCDVSLVYLRYRNNSKY